MKARLLLHIVIFCLGLCCFERAFAAVPSIKNLDIENGLSNNYVLSITQDATGILWIATENGLNRFDGKNFSQFLKDELDGQPVTISANELNKVYADKYDPYIWIATQRAGLNRYDIGTGEFTIFRHDAQNPEGIITDDITDIISSSDGNLWIATYHHGIEYFDKGPGTFTHYNRETLPELKSDQVWSLCEDPAGYLYVGHVDRGLSVISLAGNTVVNYMNDPDDPSSIPGNIVRAVYRDGSGHVWVGTDRGLALFDRASGSFTVFRHDPDNENSIGANYIFNISRLSDNRLWIGTEKGGVSVLDLGQSMFRNPAEVKFERIGDSSQGTRLSEKTVRAIYEDSFGNVWLGTYGGGVDFISHLPRFFDSWHYFDLPAGGAPSFGLTNKIAWGITVSREGDIWIGTDGGGINVFRNGRRIAVRDTSNGMPDDAVLCALTSRNGDMWFGTYGGGVIVRERSGNYIKPFDLPTDQVRCLHEDSAGNMWVGTVEGLFRWSPGEGNLTGYTGILPEKDVRAVFEDVSGKIWVGTFGQGLAVYTPSMEQIAAYNTGNILLSNTVNNIYGDKDGGIWIATGEGLVLQKRDRPTGEFLIYGVRDGIANSHIRAIIQGNDGNIWFTTSGGIGRYVLSEERFYNYNRFDGVPAGEFMSGSAAESADGTIYFGSQNGVCFFDPSEVPLNIKLPQTLIPLIRVYDQRNELSDSGREFPIERSVELKYYQNTFQFIFNVPDYALADIVEYEYRMTGMDDKWYPATENNSVTFRGLRHGRYTFTVRTRLNNQMWDSHTSSVEVVITPPFWKTWWFKMMYYLAIAAILVMANRIYRRKLALENFLKLEKADHVREQEMNDERLRFFTNVTHELRTPLTLILGPLEDIKGDPTLADKHKYKIDTIYKSSNRLLNLINQILEFRKTETSNKKLAVSQGNLADLLVETSLKYKELNTRGSVAVETVIESESNELFFDPEVIATILENLISNALKYTEQGSVTIFLRDIRIEEEVYSEIEVSDTGKGIEAEALEKIFERYYQVDPHTQHSGTGIGLALVHNLVTLHCGTITVDSVPGVGTSFRIRLPKYYTYPEARTSGSGTAPEDAINEQIEPTTDARNIILVIEDNEEIRDYIAGSLADKYTIKTAADGDEGERMAFEQIPDLVITDIMMPGTDGVELCRRLKSDVRTSHIPVIMLTARDTINDKTEGYQAGADSYITKPFSSKLLKTRIDNLFDARRKTADAVKQNTAVKDVSYATTLGQIDNEFIEKITELIEQNLMSEKTDVNYLADKMHMSHSTLYRKMKALTGITTNEFIRKVRMRNAERLLLSGRYNVSEVSFMVGINSITYFRQCFRDEFGVAPSEYIRNLKASVRHSKDGD